MSSKSPNEKLTHRIAESVTTYMDNAYSKSTQKRNLLEFKIGIIVLMIGNLFSVGLFAALSQEMFLIFSIVTMSILCGIMYSALKRGEVKLVHYFFTFIVTYIYGLVMFFQGDNSRGVFMFGLVYPVLSIYILKPLWGNLLIALELITSILAEAYVNPFRLYPGTRSIYVVIYVMFWGFSIAMEESKAYLERRMQKQQDRLTFFANYDQLTKMYNRRCFYERMEEMYPKADRVRSVSVIIMDLDNFKHINDTYGHNVGDIVLAKTAERIRRNTRGSDISCRWGGEEFLILAQACTSRSGFQLAQKICDAIGSRPYELPDGQLITVTASLGVIYIYAFDSSEITDYVRRADDNLYRAKNTGKNRVCEEAY